jgi:hypothetical protein
MGELKIKFEIYEHIMRKYMTIGVIFGSTIGAINITNEMVATRKAAPLPMLCETAMKSVGYGVMWPFAMSLIVTDWLWHPAQFKRHWRI